MTSGDLSQTRDLLEPALGHATFLELCRRAVPGAELSLSGLSGSVRYLYAAGLARALGRPLLYVVPHQVHLEPAEAALRFFAPVLGMAPEERVVSLPGLEVDPRQGTSPHPEVQSRRMRALQAIARPGPIVVVTTPKGLAMTLPPVETLRLGARCLQVGEPVRREELMASLHVLGYRKEWRVEAPGELALRGGIVDVYPAGASDPVRVELDGDWVASIRTFAPATQRSLEARDLVELPPVREVRLDAEGRSRLEAAVLARGTALGRDAEARRLLELLASRGAFPGMEMWAHAIHGARTALPAAIQAIHGTSAVSVWDDGTSAAEEYVSAREGLAEDRQGDALFPGVDDVMPPWDDLWGEARVGPCLSMAELGLPRAEGEVLHVASRRPPAFQARLGDLCRDLAERRRRGEDVVVLLSSHGTRQRIAEVMEDYGVTASPGEGRIVLALGSLAGGFELPELRLSVLTEQEVLGAVLVKGRKGERGARDARTAKGTPFRDLTDFQDLVPGDFVVHVDNGLGRYEGLVTLGAGAEARELMLLVYQGGDKLYVPLDRLDLVQRYHGPEGVAPKLDRLGGGTWERTKARVRKAVRDIGAELLKLYAARASTVGHAFAPDTPWQREFEDSFPYDETPDQESAIADVKRDMESSRPMDRLLCGDVGYGKTEVAMRAAFKAVSDGKQVAILAPTTVLAFQHLRTMQARFLPFPVKVAMLSRFVPPAEQKSTVRDVKEGKLDVLVGTHRILSKDVEYRDLGLVIIDEEQRFGVAQKEKLKALRTKVDVLTMTATPIPRTLQMALAGIRELSVIETPPRNRLSIQTTVQTFRDEVVTMAIRRELSRGGQVYFVHDRVDSIDAMAARVKELVPEARIAVGHGQMAERDMERVMVSFVEGRADVLVATTIIENGLDIPLANTLIVNRADRFGLAQLYQLRGRVGRADRRAYALLLVPSPRDLSEVARKRLAAIEEFSELGAGFRVAALDLEIRGGGNVLGAEQHGHIEAVGLDLYLRLLEEAVAELRGEPRVEEIRVNLNLKVDIRIPPDFLPDTAERMALYKRIAHAADDAAVDAIASEVRDLYGKLPPQVERLLQLTRVRNLATVLRVEAVERGHERLTLRFQESTPLPPERLLRFLAARPGAQVREGGIVDVPLTRTERDEPVDAARNLLQTLLA